MNRRPIKPISEAKKKTNAEYAKLKRVWWGEGRKCEFPGCRKLAEKYPHHAWGRAGSLQNDVRGWKAVCRFHHNWIDQNRNKARELGLLCPYGHFNDPKRIEQDLAENRKTHE